MPQISQVEVLHKRGHYHNELTRYRYDVWLRVGGNEDGEKMQPERILWKPGLTAAVMRGMLVEKGAGCVRVTGVRNSRLLSEIKIAEMLTSSDGPSTVAEMRAQLRATEVEAGVDPEEVYAFSEELGVEVDVEWARQGTKGQYDVVLRQGVKAWDVADEYAAANNNNGDAWRTSRQPGSMYANNPMQGILNSGLAQQLRNYLSERLPPYMLPSQFVMLEAVPLTPNGKVDRRALPSADGTRPRLEKAFVAPRTGVEEVLARIWAEVLSLDQVGVHDEFFRLGGHSLLATRVVSKVRKEFKIELALRSLFERPTVAGLAELIEQAQARGGEPLTPAIVPVPRTTHRMKRSH